MNFKLIPIFIFFFSLKLFADSNIMNIDISQSENEIKMVIKFDSPYSGVMVQKSGSSFYKLVLNNGIITKGYSKEIDDNNLISKISILNFPNRTDLYFYITQGIDISSNKSIDEEYLTILITKKNNLPEDIEPHGKSLLTNVSSGYVATLIILFAISILFFTMKNQFEEKFKLFSKKPVVDDNNLDWLLDNKAVSFQNIQSPQIDLKIKKKAKPTEEKEAIPKDEKTFKSLKNSKQVEVVFDDDIERGRVFMLNILNRKYLLLESTNGEITLLDKFNKQTKESKSSSKVVMPENKKEVTIIDKNFDIKLDTELKKDEEEKKTSSSNNSSDLKDIFKDSENIKL